MSKKATLIGIGSGLAAGAAVTAVLLSGQGVGVSPEPDPVVPVVEHQPQARRSTRTPEQAEAELQARLQSPNDQIRQQALNEVRFRERDALGASAGDARNFYFDPGRQDLYAPEAEYANFEYDYDANEVVLPAEPQVNGNNGNGVAGPQTKENGNGNENGSGAQSDFPNDQQIYNMLLNMISAIADGRNVHIDSLDDISRWLVQNPQVMNGFVRFLEREQDPHNPCEARAYDILHVTAGGLAEFLAAERGDNNNNEMVLSAESPDTRSVGRDHPQWKSFRNNLPGPVNYAILDQYGDILQKLGTQECCGNTATRSHSSNVGTINEVLCAERLDEFSRG